MESNVTRGRDGPGADGMRGAPEEGGAVAAGMAAAGVGA